MWTKYREDGGKVCTVKKEQVPSESRQKPCVDHNQQVSLSIYYATLHYNVISDHAELLPAFNNTDLLCITKITAT